MPGYSYMLRQQVISTPTLQIPASWTIAGELVAFVFLLITALRKLFESSGPRLLLSIAIGAVAGIGLWYLKPMFMVLGNWDLVIFFVGIAGATILCGVPIAFSFGISTIAYIFFATRIPSRSS